MDQQPGKADDDTMAMFRQEALEHLLRLETQLLSIEQRGALAGEDLAARMLADLHTLKGTARIADRQALAELCHALENVVSAAGFAGTVLLDTQFDALHEALKLARKLVEQPDGRTQNLARASVARLDAVALALAAPAARPASAAPPATAARPFAPAAATAPAAADQNPRAAPAKPGTRGTIRVPTRHLDLIRQHAEEMLMVELDLQQASERLDELDHAALSAEQMLQHCRRTARELERLRHRFGMLRNGLLDSALESSMEPFSTVFDSMPGLVRGLARAAGKEVVLQTSGGESSIDRRILEPVRDILVQLVTNAVDHGIELPQTRRQHGKPETGTVTISVAASGADAVRVVVADDGAGIDLQAVASAAARHLPEEDIAQLNPAQLEQLVFRPGLSTASALTASSGRGVGLSLVADKLAAVGGEAELASTPGQGCRFSLRLPVRLARMLGLTVRVREQRFVLPLAGLKAVQALAPDQLRMARSLGTLQWQDQVLPALPLAAALGVAEPARHDNHESDHHAVIARGAGRLFALLVDEIQEEQEVLPKPLGKQLRRVPGLTGATRLADGALVPVLALDDLARAPGHGRQAAAGAPSVPSQAPRLLVAEDSPTTRLLLKHMLELAGYEVETAVDGADAWARLRNGSHDALVSDVSMPGLTGFELCERVRAEPSLQRLPVVLVTSLQSPAEKERGLHAGANAYLSKGAFDRDTLLATLARLVGTGVA